MEISEQRFRELLDLYLKGTATPEEKDLLDRFFDSYKNEKDVHSFSTEGDTPGKQILKEVHSRIPIGRRISPAQVWLSLAAAISVFAIAWFFLEGIESRPDRPAIPIVKDRTAPGQRLTAHLPDGSIVYLNGNSSISYLKQFSSDVREVVLEGEGYFEVVPDTTPFVVRAAGMHTQVLGTSFNIEVREKSSVEVTLVEGKVNVVAASGRYVVLRPNQQAMVDLKSNAITASEVNVLRFTSWKDNVLFFEQTTLEEAVSEVETWYGVKIDIVNPRLQKCRITAKYQNEPLGNVLSSFQFLLNLTIKRLDETHFTIDGKTCK